MSIKAVAVFCGAQSGTHSLYALQAAALGRGLAKYGIDLVYGGGNQGLMGAVANSVMANGGKVIGVIPEILLAWEAQHEGITELRVVDSMHTRKKMIYDLCDAAIVLPGGNGTLDELFEMLTWNTLKIHNKKIMLLNSAGYYDHLIQHISTMAEAGFLYEDWQERLIVCADPEEIISLLVSGTFQSQP